MNTASRPRQRVAAARHLVVAVFCWTASLAQAAEPQGPPPHSAARPAAFEFNRDLAPGINVADAIEPNPKSACADNGSAAVFREIRRAGFKSVRLPVRWFAHAQASPPYTLDAAYAERVDGVIARALASGLSVIINVHDAAAMHADPAAGLPRLKQIWRQIAGRYRDHPRSLAFELLNEPHGNLGAAQWNAAVAQLLALVRASNPTRMVIVGSAQWNDIGTLAQLALPEDDAHLIAAVHYYRPFAFTHQGASWVKGAGAWLGTVWPLDADQGRAPEEAMAEAARWSTAHGRPVTLGEFGAYRAGDPESRRRWLAAVATAARAHGISWFVWEFGQGFGLFDCASGIWDASQLDAVNQ